MSRYNAINLIRITAILMVFFLHSIIFSGKNYPSSQFLIDYPWSFFFKTPAWAGCWILYIISGYLTAIGFIEDKYKFNKNNIIKFYKRKINKIFIPTIFFNFIVLFAYNFDFFRNNLEKLLISFFTFTYNGTPGVDGVGATWFVFTLMQLYIISPFICYFVSKINDTKKILILIISIALLGLFYRNLLYKLNIDWYKYIYTFILGNLDLYISGISIAYLIKKGNNENTIKENQIYKIFSVFIIFLAIIINSYYYYINNYYVYQYIFPSIYLILVLNYLFIFSDNESKTNNNIFWKFINAFASISFEFYLFHSLILSKISKYVSGSNSLIEYLKIIIFTFMITIIFSIVYNKLDQTRPDQTRPDQTRPDQT